MIIRYPHTLVYTVLPAGPDEPQQDGNGNWIPVEIGGEEVRFECRAEPNGSGRKLPAEDGNSIVYGWTIYADRDTKFIKYGTSVEVFNGITSVAKGTVKMFSPGQMNVRIYV
jgi:hypothetical protein